MAWFFRSIATLPSDTGLPEDASVNVLHWRSNGTNTKLVDANDILGRLADFYAAVDGLLSNVVGSPARFEVYDLTDPEPRQPLAGVDSALTTAVGSPLPTECAVCISFQAVQLSGLIAARRRGRIFLGPMDSSAVAAVGSKALVSATAINTIGIAFAAACFGATADDPRIAVFSPTTLGLGSDYEAAVNEVAEVWIDNAWDTQRRRGTSATSRATFVPS